MDQSGDEHDEWGTGSSRTDDESGDSDEYEESLDEETNELESARETRSTRTSKEHADPDARAESQILGDFNRKMEEIKTTTGDQSLGKSWDFTIADNDPENFDLQDELREATGIGKRKKGKGRARGPRQVQLSQEVDHMLGQANDAYAEGDRETAIELLQNVIKIEPNVPNAWSTLALCHEEAGDTRRALQLRIMAAHLTGDADAWAELGLESRENGLMEQAVYCYRNATRLDKTNPDVLWDYAFCLRESGQTQKAIKTYESILRILPHDLTILAQLRDLLVQSGALERATDLYSAAFDYYVSTSTAPTATPSQSNIVIDPLLASVSDPTSRAEAASGFGTREVATLADLLSGLGRHTQAVEVVICGAKWLGQVPASSDEGSLGDKLDVNLRMRLAVAKLRLGELDAGKLHASIILAHDINEFYELYTELADVFFEIGIFVDAVAIYERLACQPHTSSFHVLKQIGQCHKQMKNYAAARDVYRRIIDVDPDEHDTKMKLAEIYEILNEKRLALDLVNEVIRAREQIPSRNSTSEPLTPADVSLFVEKSHPVPATTAAAKKPANKPTITPAEAQRLNRERTDAVIRGFKRLKEIDPGEICSEGEEVAGRWTEWLSVADALVEIFDSEKRLHVTDRYKGFQGEKKRPRGSKAADEGAEVIAVDYRGIKLTEWLRFLIRYSFAITKYRGRYNQANELLNRLSLSVAYQDWQQQNTIWLALLAVSVFEGKVKAVAEYARKLMTRHQFNNDALRLLLASLGGGITSAEVFVDSALQKYLFREMSLFERAAKGEPATFIGKGRNRWDFNNGKPGDEEEGDLEPTGKAGSVDASNPAPVLATIESPAYIAAYGQISGGTRSYQTEIYYLFKAYDLEPNDPVICLSLGTACIGRAMQRQADNRNHMVTQGFAFLNKYRSLRAGEGPLQAEEVDYNLGRGFQQLGLQAFAQKHYQAVLENVNKRRQADNSAPLGIAREAAYNLSLIYVISGSAPLAQELYCHWLSF